jgi:hypothetical protein
MDHIGLGVKAKGPRPVFPQKFSAYLFLSFHIFDFLKTPLQKNSRVIPSPPFA